MAASKLSLLAVTIATQIRQSSDIWEKQFLWHILHLNHSAFPITFQKLRKLLQVLWCKWLNTRSGRPNLPWLNLRYPTDAVSLLWNMYSSLILPVAACRTTWRKPRTRGYEVQKSGPGLGQVVCQCALKSGLIVAPNIGKVWENLIIQWMDWGSYVQNQICR